MDCPAGRAIWHEPDVRFPLAERALARIWLVLRIAAVLRSGIIVWLKCVAVLIVIGRGQIIVERIFRVGHVCGSPSIDGRRQPLKAIEALPDGLKF